MHLESVAKRYNLKQTQAITSAEQIHWFHQILTLAQPSKRQEKGFKGKRYHCSVCCRVRKLAETKNSHEVSHDLFFAEIVNLPFISIRNSPTLTFITKL